MVNSALLQQDPRNQGLPGGVDTHVHLENVIGCDTFESGTRAAAFGGTTTIVDFALRTETDSPLATIARTQRNADPQVAIDYGLSSSSTSMRSRLPMCGTRCGTRA
jgi:dihydroorotase-like cyclic amidohydrolase